MGWYGSHGGADAVAFTVRGVSFCRVVFFLLLHGRVGLMRNISSMSNIFLRACSASNSWMIHDVYSLRFFIGNGGELDLVGRIGWISFHLLQRHSIGDNEL